MLAQPGAGYETFTKSSYLVDAHPFNKYLIKTLHMLLYVLLEKQNRNCCSSLKF